MQQLLGASEAGEVWDSSVYAVMPDRVQRHSHSNAWDDQRALNLTTNRHRARVHTVVAEYEAATDYAAYYEIPVFVADDVHKDGCGGHYAEIQAVDSKQSEASIRINSKGTYSAAPDNTAEQHYKSVVDPVYGHDVGSIPRRFSQAASIKKVFRTIDAPSPLSTSRGLPDNVDDSIVDVDYDLVDDSVGASEALSKKVGRTSGNQYYSDVAETAVD